MELELIEREQNRYDFPAVIIKQGFCKSIYFSSFTREKLNITDNSSIVYSVDRESGDVYFGIEIDIDSGLQAYKYKAGASGVALPKNLRYKIDVGVYRVNLTPTYQKGLDWYKLEKV